MCVYNITTTKKLISFNFLNVENEITIEQKVIVGNYLLGYTI